MGGGESWRLEELSLVRSSGPGESFGLAVAAQREGTVPVGTRDTDDWLRPMPGE